MNYCNRDTDGDGNCHVHPHGCPAPRPVAVALIFGDQVLTSFTEAALREERRCLLAAVPRDHDGDAAQMRGYIAKIDDELRSRGLEP